KTPHRIPIARSSDLVSWTHVGDAFSDATVPSWADTSRGAALWAPDIRYVDGQYRLYYVVTETTATDEPNDNAVGMATAPTPVGPWTDSGAPVVGPRRGGAGEPGNFLWTFDPSAVTDTDGSQWLFYGSYYGGIFVQRLTDDGTRVVGDATRVAIDNKFEGAYVVRRGGYWYLFASTANCCAGPTTGYSVQVGRSRDLRGPYVDRDGVPLTASRAGGTPALVQNGNRWVGAGHNAVVTDLAGQDWIAYHAIDRGTPYLAGTDGINRRPMLLDRLDWVDGWPTTRAGAGPSATPQPAPATSGVRRLDDGTVPPSGWAAVGRWTSVTDAQSGRAARSQGPAALVDRHSVGGDVRVEADVRSSGAAVGLAVGDPGARDGVVALVQPTSHRLVVQERRAGRVVRSEQAALPAGTDSAQWHALALDVRRRTAHVQLSSARLGDPLADVTLTLRADAGPRAAVVADAAGADVDNLSAVAAARPVTRLVRDDVPSRLDASASDEFTGSSLAPGWSWVREDDAATVGDGVLRWPTEAADLTGTSNDAGVLLRDPGDGDWTIQTRVTNDLGTDDVRNFQQGGLVVYVDDDLFVRLSHVAIWNTRQTEFGKEMPYAGRLSYGGTIVGPPDTTTELRITHHVDAATGEHLLRAWSRRPGDPWVRGGVWTLPAGSQLRVGLVSHGGAGATNDFDYFRLYR
ncbi:MAG: family 43 glycosylhydrolase, partial [Angustibacter sp.]